MNIFKQLTCVALLPVTLFTTTVSAGQVEESNLVEVPEYYTGDKSLPAQVTPEQKVPKDDDEPTVLSFTLHSGLLKPQLEKLVNKYLPNKEVYWDSYEGMHEWYGDSTIKGKSVDELLNKITSAYGAPPKGIVWKIHLNVVQFIYKNSKG